MPSRVESKPKSTRSNSATKIANLKESNKPSAKVAKPATKKATKSVAKPKSTLPTYKDMINEGIATLKDRNGSSRQALKKYIIGKYSVGDGFESRFNLAVRRGIESGDFSQPKGSSGPLKSVKKGAIKPELGGDIKKAASEHKKVDVADGVPKRRRSSTKTKEEADKVELPKGRRSSASGTSKVKTGAPKVAKKGTGNKKELVSKSQPVRSSARKIKA